MSQVTDIAEKEDQEPMADQVINMEIFFFCPMSPPHVLVDFVVLPPGHGRSVTDF